MLVITLEMMSILALPLFIEGVPRRGEGVYRKRVRILIFDGKNEQ